LFEYQGILAISTVNTDKLLIFILFTLTFSQSKKSSEIGCVSCAYCAECQWTLNIPRGWW